MIHLIEVITTGLRCSPRLLPAILFVLQSRWHMIKYITALMLGLISSQAREYPVEDNMDKLVGNDL